MILHTSWKNPLKAAPVAPKEETPIVIKKDEKVKKIIEEIEKETSQDIENE